MNDFLKSLLSLILQFIVSSSITTAILNNHFAFKYTYFCPADTWKIGGPSCYVPLQIGLPVLIITFILVRLIFKYVYAKQ